MFGRNDWYTHHEGHESAGFEVCHISVAVGVMGDIVVLLLGVTSSK